MKTEKIRVYFVQGYSGSVKAGVMINEKDDYVIDMDWLKEYLAKQLEEKGYTTSKTNRQKYPRIIINL